MREKRRQRTQKKTHLIQRCITTIIDHDDRGFGAVFDVWDVQTCDIDRITEGTGNIVRDCGHNKTIMLTGRSRVEVGQVGGVLAERDTGES